MIFHDPPIIGLSTIISIASSHSTGEAYSYNYRHLAETTKIAEWCRKECDDLNLSPKPKKTWNRTYLFISVQTPLSFHSVNQWPFQDPKSEIPTIYEAYVSPM